MAPGIRTACSDGPAGWITAGIASVGGNERRNADVSDPNRFSEREVQLLQELAERRNVLDARERQLEEREASIESSRTKVVEKQAN